MNAGDPFRSNFPGGTFAYGCPPIDTSPKIPGDGLPTTPPLVPFDLSGYKPEQWALTPCPRCGRHIRVTRVTSVVLAEPCPWCLRADLDAFRLALGDKAKPADEIATLREALRATVAALRDISRVTGSGKLDDIIAQADRALEAGEARLAADRPVSP
jgi:hypothetical protein